MSDTPAMQEQIRHLFLECFHIDVPTPDTDLFETGALDSLQIVELILQLEQRFNLKLEIEQIDLEDLRSLERIALLAQQGGPSSPLAFGVAS